MNSTSVTRSLNRRSPLFRKPASISITEISPDELLFEQAINWETPIKMIIILWHFILLVIGSVKILDLCNLTIFYRQTADKNRQPAGTKGWSWAWEERSRCCHWKWLERKWYCSRFSQAHTKANRSVNQCGSATRKRLGYVFVLKKLGVFEPSNDFVFQIG